MYNYLSLLFNICLFQKGPQDIPFVPQLLRHSIIGYTLISFLLLKTSVDSLNALLQVGVELVIIIGFTRLVLIIAHKPSRFTQTCCALLGTDAFISFLAMPVIKTLNIDNSNVLASFVLLALMLWSWLVTAHIFRHAINKPFSLALGIVFLYIFSAYFLIGELFPPVNSPT